MKSMKRFLCAGAVVGALMACSATASAADVVNAVSGGPFSLPSNTVGTIDGIDVASGNNYEWTFTIAGPEPSVLSQIQASVNSGGSATSENIAFSLFSGTPGSGTLIASTSSGKGPSLTESLVDGSYFVELTSANIAVNDELVSGSIQLFPAVPEPATWTMMILGMFGLGYMLRRSRAQGHTSLLAA